MNRQRLWVGGQQRKGPRKIFLCGLLLAACGWLLAADCFALDTAYRNRLGAQFLESFVTFIYKKREVARLQALPSRTPGEENTLSHYRRDLAKDRATFLAWYELIKTSDGYTEVQIKNFLLNNRAAILDLLKARHQQEMDEITAKRAALVAEIDAILADAQLSEAERNRLLQEKQPLAVELDNRLTLPQFWRDLVQELKDKSNADFQAEAEIP